MSHLFDFHHHDLDPHVGVDNHHPGAIDSDGDGFPDHVEKTMGTNPHDPNDHPHFVDNGVGGMPPTHGHLSIKDNLTGVDSDRDGFSDAVEAKFGTNPHDPSSHPHFDAGVYKAHFSNPDVISHTDVRIEDDEILK